MNNNWYPIVIWQTFTGIPPGFVFWFAGIAHNFRWLGPSPLFAGEPNTSRDSK